MVQYQSVHGSVQARQTPSSVVTCDYRQDLVFVPAAWQAVVSTGACANDERWSRFVSVPGLPSPGSVAAGTIMDDAAPNQNTYGCVNNVCTQGAGSLPAGCNNTCAAPTSNSNKIVILIVVAVALYFMWKR